MMIFAKALIYANNPSLAIWTYQIGLVSVSVLFLTFMPFPAVILIPPQIVTATGVCNKNFFGFTTQDGKLYYASKIYAAYQSLIESSPVPTPPPSVSFDDLLQGGA